MVTLHILSGGAAQGLVRTLADDFESQHELHLSGTFGAVGAMKQKLTDGTPCDVLILTRPMVQDLIQQGLAMADTAQDLGVVKTGVAVLAGQPPVAVATPDALRQTLRKASAIYFPDPQLATAGIHFMKVLQKLGLADELADLINKEVQAEAGRLACDVVLHHLREALDRDAVIFANLPHQI